MTRLVVQLSKAFDSSNNEYVLLSLEEPKPPIDSPGRAFACTVKDAPLAAMSAGQLEAETVREAGSYLFNALMQHPEVKDYVVAALHAPADQRFPFYVEFATVDHGLEELPWEALCAPDVGFLGLDDRFAIGRIVSARAAKSSFWTLQSPLRMAAVLSALNVPAEQEWQAIRAALAHIKDVDVALLVLVSEETLFNEIQQGVADGTLPPLTRVELVTGFSGLKTALTDFRPNVLHFFCHGSTEGGPRLQIATKSDWLVEPGGTATPFIVEALDIAKMSGGADASPWVVVLNSCESGAGGDLQSLALGVVSDVGIPAAIGMREPVVSSDASLFTAAFYAGLFAEVARLLDAGGGAPVTEVDLDWARLVTAARDPLTRQVPNVAASVAAASTKAWTLPLVYMLPEPFVLHLAANGAAAPSRQAQLEIELYRGLLQQLPPDAPTALYADIRAKLTALEQQVTV